MKFDFSPVLSLVIVFSVCIGSLAVQSACYGQSNLEKAMKFRPKQPGIEIDTPEDLKGCEIKPTKTAEGKSGWVVFNANSQLIRRFIDHNSDGALDAMSYYKSGIEVYRDIDTDFDKKFDQFRWFGTAGMRWGIDDDQDGSIDSWKVISAEEVSYEVVEAIRTKNAARFNALLLDGKELGSLGVSADQKDEISKRINKAKSSFSSFVRQQKMIDSDSKWIHFSGLLPGVIPADTQGSKADVTFYDNVAAVINNGGRTAGQLSIGTLVKSGDSWRVVDLPESIIEGQALKNGGLFFQSTSVGSIALASNSDQGGFSDADQKLFQEYEQLDQEIQKARSSRELQPLNAKRAKLFIRLVDAASTDENRTNWIRQMADVITAAYQQAEYDDGIDFMKDAVKSLQKVKEVEKADIVYCQYRVITSFYSRKMNDATTDELEETQDEYMNKLEQFVRVNPKDSNAADAMLQLALDDEAAGNINAARDWYKNITDDFPDSDLVTRAAGANLRLNSEGKTIPFHGPTLKGGNYDLADHKGKVVLIQYWATWCEPCKNDMRQIKEAYDEYHRRGFEVVSVSLDNELNDLKGYLQKNPLPWTHVFTEGDLDSSMAEQLGIAMVPTMILVGADGKVINRSVLSQDLDKLLSRQFSRSARRDNK